MQISDHFSVTEALRTDRGNLQGGNLTAFGVPEALQAARLAHRILEPWRYTLGVPIRVVSWFRSPELNKAVGGAVNSEHLTGGAVDVIPRCDLWLAYEWLEHAPIGQRIIYLKDGKPQWIHVGMREHRPVNRSLVCILGKAKIYEPYNGKARV
jgi:zinc D-Ala-D-Ala carboxypeptidase